ncbi:acetyltransferase [Dethiosulfatarculus sandiegensis]|uniref:Acetyltransferase n=2 Tax=Dethiosulfatarculus sandiegensis TaxID=1429043 RepID=A0A0D2GA22_9BACT|nr:acetyltransferase [Dethiosulfatarculus sandiegensis]
MIRKAMQSDVLFIHGLLADYAAKGIVIARPISRIYDALRDFFVAEDEKGRRVGCCALSIIWENTCEVRSLVVAPQYQGQGWGGRLVRACLEEAIELKFHRIFTLTLETGFFASLGFKEVDKKELPHKIWTDCINCIKFPDACDETAMILDLPKQGD